MRTKENNTVYFDDNCPLCQSAVKFVHKRDGNKIFSFTPLITGTQYTVNDENNKEEPLSVVYIRDGIRYYRSSAVLLMLRDMGWPWKLLYAFIAVPVPVRDYIYNLVARNRLKLFTKTG